MVKTFQIFIEISFATLTIIGMTLNISCFKADV